MRAYRRVERNLYELHPDVRMKRVATAQKICEEGMVAEGEGNTDAAIERYRCALEYDPVCVGALINLGTLMYQRKDFAAAEMCYREAVGADPHHALAWFDLGVIEEERSSEAAMRCYRRALEYDSSRTDAHFNLAQLHEKMGQWRAAAVHYSEYLAHTDDPQVWRDLAKHRLEMVRKHDLRLVKKAPEGAVIREEGLLTAGS